MIVTAGIYKGRKIHAPDEKITRPTLSKVRMGVFNTLYSLMGSFDGKTFLDAFGGSGIMGIEAFSRGFGEVKVFELNKKSAEIIKKNYANLNLKVDLTIGDSLKLIQKLNKNYDVIYIDPPYQSGIYEKILPTIKSGIIVAEHSEDFNTDKYTILKQKNYGGKKVTFLTKAK